jgi:hypothetical protein
MNHSLISSDEQFACQASGDFEPYLFQSSTQRVEFVVIAEELEELNDYCVAAQDATNDILRTHEQTEQRIASGDTLDIPTDADLTIDDVHIGLIDSTIPKWQHINQFISHATTLLLLHVFVERSLKALCLALSPAETERAKQLPGKSKIDSYLSFLKESCSLSFEESEESEELRNAVRLIRNDFAHGDWEKVEDACKRVGLRMSFSVSAELFEAIENSTLTTCG